MTRLTVFRWVGGVVTVATLASAFAATTGSRRFAERRYAERTAASAAAYLTLVTSTSRVGAPPLDPASFLRRVRALVALPDWSPDVEVYLGTAPLVHATDPSLPLSTIAMVAARTQPQWIEGAALAPIPGPVPGRLVGVARVRPHLPVDPFAPWLLALLGATALAGVLASAQLRRRRWGWWLAAYAVAALAFGGVAVGAANTGMRAATVQWLRETGVLIEDAGSRLPRTPTSTIARTFSALAADGHLVVDTSSDPVLERALAGTRPGSPLPIWLGGGRWLSLVPPPDEWAVAARDAIAGTAALAGVLALVAFSWGARDRARPGQTEETISAWMFLAPAGVHLTALTVAPLALLVYVALHRWDLLGGGGKFVGWENLVAITTRGDTWTALGRTALFTLHVPVATGLALALALAARRAATRLVRVLLVAPPFASVAAVGLAWRNGLTAWGWLDRPETALWMLAGIAAVLQVGYQVPAFLAGLDRIPEALWEAAALDGAGPWSRFRRVTEPLLRPLTLSILVTGVVVAVQVFTLPRVTGPHAPELAAPLLYRHGWGEGRLDLAAAFALLLTVLLVIVGVLQVRLWGRGVTDEA
ncbi:MAG TPA: sugar ABC transporter permease [Gemmatimonadales bacterium]|nr:sugar ABC transporter permease [Gemmatimonadales bacterium]